MNMRSDCFASRLTITQREEVFADIEGGMALKDVGEKIQGWSVPKRLEPPSRQSISDWFRRMKAERHAQEIGRPAGADGPELFEIDEQIERGLRRAKHQWVMHGLDPQQLAALERNELQRRKLELEERKHEFAMRMAEQKREWEKIEAKIEAAMAEVVAAREELADAKAKKDEARRKLAEQRTAEMVNLMLIEIQRSKFGEEWMPERLPDGRYKIYENSEPVDLPFFTEMTKRLQRIKERKEAEAAAAAEAAETPSSKLQRRSNRKENKGRWGNAEVGTRSRWTCRFSRR